jgi:hypothetical protein
VARGLHHPAALLLALAILPACVEIDPAYAESFSTTTAAGTTTDTSTTSSGDSTGTPACDCTAYELCEADTCTPPAKILFVNLDGVATTFGAPDASQDSQGLYEELAGTWSAYGADEATRQTLLGAIEQQWAAYRVIVTDVRPDPGSAPYMMAVVTATPPPAGFEGVAYIAFPDCGETIAQDVSFVFAAPSDGFGVPAHANWVSGAFGRGLGLHYNDATDDIMGTGDRFVETCYPIAEMPPCTAHHPELCSDDPMQQSSHLELEALLGARG